MISSQANHESEASWSPPTADPTQVPIHIKIDAHAYRLLGESQETIDRETRELFEAFRRQSPPLLRRSEAFGFAFALRELVRERIREIEGRAA
jgi:hypothetical protein